MQHVVLTATPAEPAAGEPVTLTAEGFNVYEDSLGDVTDDIVFDDPSDDSIVRDGNQVTFAEAGTYTITGRHSVTERPVSVEIEVRPASTATPVDEDEDDESSAPVAEETVASADKGAITAERVHTTEPEQRRVLPATGAEISPGAGAAGALALALGLSLLIVGRRRTSAQEGTR